MKFVVNHPFETDQPDVDVDAGLPPGAYRFQLEVIDGAGRRSKPAQVVVTILERIVVPPVVIDPPIITPPLPAPRPVVPGGLPVPISPIVTPTPAPPTPGPRVARPAATPRRSSRRRNPPKP